MRSYYKVCKYAYVQKGNFLFLTSPSKATVDPIPALTNSRRVLLHACTHTQRQIHILTHIYLPAPLRSLFSEDGLAGGDLPLLGGFPGCLINYPTPIVYQEAREEQEKAQNGHCQVGGIHFPGSSAWGVARRGEKDRETGAVEQRGEEREECGSLAAGIR